MTEAELDEAESIDALLRAIACLKRFKVDSEEFKTAMELLTGLRDSMLRKIESTK